MVLGETTSLEGLPCNLPERSSFPAWRQMNQRLRPRAGQMWGGEGPVRGPLSSRV